MLLYFIIVSKILKDGFYFMSLTAAINRLLMMKEFQRDFLRILKSSFDKTCI